MGRTEIDRSRCPGRPARLVQVWRLHTFLKRETPLLVHISGGTDGFNSANQRVHIDLPVLA